MIKAVTGTKDIIPSKIQKWKYLEQIVNDTFIRFNYKEIRTPIFEVTSLFERSIGEATDIVSKEMYTFIDRGGDSLTLRPELTASVVRALIENSLEKKQNLNKLYYIGPMFRQERPQAGRLRQFHQFGAEAIGSKEPLLDAEIIIIAFDIISKLGLKNLSVKINSLGTPSSREKYKSILREYLNDKTNSLSEESKKRLDLNILRIFDSKDEKDKMVMANAPLLINYLESESIEHFGKVKSVLSNAGIPFDVDPILVRGLDYYTHTTFEINSQSVGSQSALCGGGRYNGLVKEIGGPDLPGVGFAAGIERILLACKNENSFSIEEQNPDLYVVSLDKQFQNKSFDLALKLRRNGLTVELDYLNRSVKAQMREANKLKAKFVMIIGVEEFSKGEVVLKNMIDGKQNNLTLYDWDSIVNKIKEV